METIRKLPGFFRAALRAIDEAGRDPTLVAWVGAAIVRGGALVGTGANRRGSSALAGSARPGYAPRCGTVHAEVDAVVRARRRVDLRGCRLYVAREVRAGSTAIARPCAACMAILGRYGFESVCYTVDGGGWSAEPVPKPRRIRTAMWLRSQAVSRRRAARP